MKFHPWEQYNSCNTAISRKKKKMTNVKPGSNIRASIVRDALESATTVQTLQKSKTADALLAAAGAAGSLALLQVTQDCVSKFTDIETPIIGGFLASSAVKFFFNRRPPTLEGFWKSTAFSIVIGSSLHKFLWMTSESEDGPATLLSKEYNGYVILFFMILFWKLHPGTIWSAGTSLASFIAFQSGFWGKYASENGSFRTLATDFPTWFILGPYLVGHSYLYVCALGVAKIRRRVRIYLMRNDIFSSNKQVKSSTKHTVPDRLKIKLMFDRIDVNGDGRLDAMELKLALRATTGDELSLEECQQMIGEVDTDGDGTLDYNEFYALVDDIALKL